MIFTDYYRFCRPEHTQSATRMDCAESTKSYPPFESKRATKNGRSIMAGDIVLYLCNRPEKYRGDLCRVPDKSITMKGENISSVFNPYVEMNIAFGDCKGTSDALIFRMFDTDTINGSLPDCAELEIFVARGQSGNRMAIYNMVVGGELEEEMNALADVALERCKDEIAVRNAETEQPQQ